MFWIAEHTAVPGDAHGPDFASPSIYILKDVTVNGAVVRITQSTVWKWFSCSLHRDFGFESIELLLVSQV
jgi:hypothetical protein